MGIDRDIVHVLSLHFDHVVRRNNARLLHIASITPVLVYTSELAIMSKTTSQQNAHIRTAEVERLTYDRDKWWKTWTVSARRRQDNKEGEGGSTTKGNFYESLKHHFLFFTGGCLSSRQTNSARVLNGKITI